jgi:hypothetical protein
VSIGFASVHDAARWSVAFLPDDREVRLRCYRNALRNWKVRGYVEFKKRAEEWLVRELAELSLRAIRGALHDYVEHGGVIDEQVEQRPEYTHYEFHYDLRVTIGDRRIYFETILTCEDAGDPDDPAIIVVNVHDV